MRYQFLLFDLDRTLLDFDADEAMAFRRLYQAQGWEKTRPYAPELLTLYDDFNNRWWRKFEAGECTKQELFENRFVEFMAAVGLTGDPVQVNARYFQFLGQGGVAYPGALELLKELSARAEVYIVTNGNAATAKTRIANSGVGAYCKAYFVSETVGYAKPDPRYFEYVAAHIPGFEKEKAIVIGDSPITDIRGAAAAGLDSLWYHPGGASEEEVPCTCEASGFREIAEILSR